MSKNAERAYELFHQGYSCAQSVFGAYAESLGLDFDTAVRISSSFGAGFGRMRLVCGAFSGLCMAAGLKYASSDPSPQAKAAQYRCVQALAKQFRADHGSIICRELLGGQASTEPTPETRTEGYYQKRPCDQLVRYAAELLDTRDWSNQPED